MEHVASCTLRESDVCWFVVCTTGNATIERRCESERDAGYFWCTMLNDSTLWNVSFAESIRWTIEYCVCLIICWLYYWRSRSYVECKGKPRIIIAVSVNRQLKRDETRGLLKEKTVADGFKKMWNKQRATSCCFGMLPERFDNLPVVEALATTEAMYAPD